MNKRYIKISYLVRIHFMLLILIIKIFRQLMGIRKSSTNKEKKTALPSQSIKSIGKPSNSVHNW